MRESESKWQMDPVEEEGEFEEIFTRNSAPGKTTVVEH